MNKIINFIGHINYIGGVEQWMYYIAKKYSSDYDIECVYKWAAPQQLNRLRKFIKCTKFEEQEVKCDIAILSYDLSFVDKIKAKEYILTIHADYKAQNLRITIPKQITKVYCVSELVKKSFIETHGDQLKKLGLECEVLYNPVMLDEPKKILKLVSATRLTPEKGRERMEILAKALHNKGIPFIWLVFTNDKLKSDLEELIYMKPRLDILGYIKESDYLVQLSDTEGFAYSINESLNLKIPVIVTDLPVLNEMKVKDGVNGYVLKMDMSNIDVDKIYNKIPKFDYSMVESEKEWTKILGKKSKSDYVYNSLDIDLPYIAINNYTDMTLNKLIIKDTRISDEYREKNKGLTQARIDYLISLDLIKEE